MRATVHKFDSHYCVHIHGAVHSTLFNNIDLIRVTLDGVTFQFRLEQVPFSTSLVFGDPDTNNATPLNNWVRKNGISEWLGSHYPIVVLDPSGEQTFILRSGNN